MYKIPLKVLTSTSTANNIGTSILIHATPQEVELLTPENTLPGSPIDVAFVSRDVTGLSTKHETHPDTQRFYDLMKYAPKLQWMHIHSAGADRPIYLELQARGTLVTTSAGSNAEIVAQTAVAGLLAIGRRFPELWQAQQQRTWAPLIQRPLPSDVHTQTATIVGWGGIGQSIARILRAVGMKIQVVRSSATPTHDGLPSYSFEDIDKVLPCTDWLILACPLTSRTQHLICSKKISLLPISSYLINVSRGDVVDENALIAALQSGHIGGAYLDVFAHEPLSKNSVLWSMRNVIVTPHSAGFSAGNAQRVAEIFLENLRAFTRKEQLRNVVTFDPKN